jgi:hypothetical protein
MPRRRKPAGLECLVDIARKAEILEREMSAQRAAMERLKERKASATTARPTTSLPNWIPGTAR